MNNSVASLLFNILFNNTYIHSYQNVVYINITTIIVNDRVIKVLYYYFYFLNSILNVVPRPGSELFTYILPW